MFLRIAWSGSTCGFYPPERLPFKHLPHFRGCGRPAAGYISGMARILIAGCGYVGSALGAQLVRDGHEVWGIRRSRAGLPEGIRLLQGDLSDPALLSRLPDGIDTVFYTASPDGFVDEAYRRTYVEDLQGLLHHLEETGAARLLFTGSTAVYGTADGAWVDEESPAVPAGFPGRRILDGEAILAASPLRTVSARLGGIYGPGRTRLLDQVRRGDARLLPPPTVWSNRIHRDDAAGLLRHLMDLDDPEPCYLGVDTRPADRNEIVSWLARRLGLPVPETDPDASRGSGLRGNKRCSSRRLQQSGYSFRYPTWREGYEAILEGYDSP